MGIGSGTDETYRLLPVLDQWITKRSGMGAQAAAELFLPFVQVKRRGRIANTQAAHGIGGPVLGNVAGVADGFFQPPPKIGREILRGHDLNPGDNRAIGERNDDATPQVSKPVVEISFVFQQAAGQCDLPRLGLQQGSSLRNGIVDPRRHGPDRAVPFGQAALLQRFGDGLRRVHFGL